MWFSVYQRSPFQWPTDVVYITLSENCFSSARVVASVEPTENTTEIKFYINYWHKNAEDTKLLTPIKNQTRQHMFYLSHLNILHIMYLISQKYNPTSPIWRQQYAAFRARQKNGKKRKTNYFYNLGLFTQSFTPTDSSLVTLDMWNVA